MKRFLFLYLLFSALYAQQPQTVLILPWSADNSPAYSILPEGRYGPQAFSVIDNKIYLLDNKNNRLNIYQSDQLVNNYSIPEGCYNLAVSEQNIYVSSADKIWSVDKNGFDMVYHNSSKQPITKLFTNNSKQFFQLSNNATKALNRDQNTSLMKTTETDPLFYTEKINKNLARVFFKHNGQKIEFEITFPESDLASIRFLEKNNKDRLYFVVERFTRHVPLEVSREVRQYNFQGNLINRVEIPGISFTLCANDIFVSADSQFYYLHTTENNLQILRWDLSIQHEQDLKFFPEQEVDQKESETFHEKESKDNSLLKISDLPEVTPDQALITGDSYVQLTWSCNSDNLTNGLITDSYGYLVRTPSWVTPGTHQNVVYKWGGFQTLEQFVNGLNNGKYAGDNYTSKNTGTPSAVGVDCSGFVSRCWNLPSHYSTRMMDDAITLPYDNWEQTKPGDAAHKVGHVRLIVEHNPDGTITMVESAGYNWRVSYRAYSYAELYNYTPRYYINMQGTPGNIPQPVLAYVRNNVKHEVAWNINSSSEISGLKLFESADPESWLDFHSINTDESSIELDLDVNNCVFHKMNSVANDAGQTESLPSDVYGAYGNQADKILIVDGFDRTSATNGSWNHVYHSFAAVYGELLHDLGISFETAANEALLNGQINIQDYKTVFWFVGDESTADETLNSSEQQIVKNYLQNGGQLFISGSEIAWDLDYKGASSDRSFFNNYLKADYLEDDSGNYSVYGASGSIFEGINLNYDNGTHGVYQEDYPDVIKAINGSQTVLYYGNDKSAAVIFDDTFDQGSKPAKLFYMGFPFETIYNSDQRLALMERITQFFGYSATAIAQNESAAKPKDFELFGNFPNPFNNQTNFHFYTSRSENIDISIFNRLGQLVYSDSWQSRVGNQVYKISTYNWASGVYFYTFRYMNRFDQQKFIIVK